MLTLLVNITRDKTNIYRTVNEISRKCSQFSNISQIFVDSSNEHATFSGLVTVKLMDKGSELSLELSVSAELMEY